MNLQTISVFFDLLRSAVNDIPLTDSEKALFSEEMLPDIFALAKSHEIAHLLAMGLNQNPVLREETAKAYMIEGEMIRTMFWYEQDNLKYTRLCHILEEAEIPFLPLKGMVLRQWYPKPWMRTCGDIDILLHKEDLERAVQLLTTQYGYTFSSEGTHDIVLKMEGNLYVELHYLLVEDGIVNSAELVLRDVWNHATLSKDKKYQYEMSDAMFYFYHIAHMAKHFYAGGCGIRSFADIWVLNHMIDFDASKRDALLRQGDLLRFSQVVYLLSQVWFGSETHTPLTRQVEYYILRGGVYGSAENRITVQQQKTGGRLKYTLSRVFLPYHVIKHRYPILKKHRWLTPVMQMRRWVDAIFTGRSKHVVEDLSYNLNISDTEAQRTRAFLDSIGL